MIRIHRSISALVTTAVVAFSAGFCVSGRGFAATSPPSHSRAKPAPKTPEHTPHAGDSHTPESAGPHSLKPAALAQRKAAIKSITSQLDAFRRNDYATAATYQSSGLRENFPTVDAFRKMMQSSYPEFANYRTVQFGPALADTSGRHLIIQVKLTGADHLTVDAAYLMVLEEKIFRVDGVLGGHASGAPTINA